MTELALFPLQTVLFPGGRLAVRVFEKRYLDMVTACMKADREFGVCLIKRGTEVGVAAEPQEVGTFARVMQCDMERAGILNIVMRGTGRFRAGTLRVQKDQLLLADVERLADAGTMALPERHERLREALRHVLEQAGEASYFPPPCWDDAAWVSGRLAELLPLPLGLKQALLELDDLGMRLDVLAELFPPPPDAPTK